MRYRMAISVTVLLLSSGLACAQEKLPNCAPASSTPEQQELIREGTAAHDAGKYDAAIADYKQVLEQSPDNVNAMYELSFTYFTTKDYKDSIAMARHGAKCQSNLLPQFYMILGNSLDDSGKHQEAIDIYRAAIKESPATALLHYNLALSFFRSAQMEEAKIELEQSVSLDPNHASSHYLLGRTYQQLGYRVPAVLALSRFLILEPNSPRSPAAIDELNHLISAGITPTAGAKPGDLTITVPFAGAKKDEGDFSSVELGLSLGVVAAQTEKGKQESQLINIEGAYAAMADVMSRMKRNGFAARYYAPFFAAMQDQNLTTAFVSQAFQRAHLSGANEWVAQNDADVKKYQAWLAAYRWPAYK